MSIKNHPSITLSSQNESTHPYLPKLAVVVQGFRRMDLLIETNEVLYNAANPLIKTSTIQEYYYDEDKINNEDRETQMVLNDVDNILVKCHDKYIQINDILCNNLTFPFIFKTSVNAENIPFADAFTGNTPFNSSSQNTSYSNHITQFTSDQNSSFIPPYHLSDEAVSDDMFNDDDSADLEFTLSTVVIPTTGIGLYILSLLTFVGNAMVLHAIRTDKRLQTVRENL